MHCGPKTGTLPRKISYSRCRGTVSNSRPNNKTPSSRVQTLQALWSKISCPRAGHIVKPNLAKRNPNEKVKHYIVHFDRQANIAKKHNMELPATVLGLKLLHDAGLSTTNKKLVMSEVDFKETET